jgi:NAD(P)-dependent dehydrogenase (short-subunit alcohol dehydrogenase family)
MSEMTGKDVVITGGTAGIGKAAAHALAALGARVTILGRSHERGESAVQQMQAATANACVSFVACDLGDQASVRRAADEIQRGRSKLDVLINNAGIFLPRRELTTDGVEKTFASVYLGHFLLTQLLLDRLKAAPEGRIVFVAAPPSGTKLFFDDLNLDKGYSTFKAVGQAKAAQHMLARELTRRLAGSQVTVNTMHPGLVKTELMAQMPFYLRMVLPLFGAAPESGADTAVWLATTPEVRGLSGRYFYKRKEKPMSGQATDDAACARLWELSLARTGLAADATAAQK